ncbi:MAG: cardiolipin synthase [Planctomycetes bacterium]|nr:cardiolipin synthase [Planctomycetota bacterium]
MELWQIIVAIFPLTGWLIALAMVPVLARRCSVAKAWGWLAVMFAAPWVGLGLYLLFGENPLGRRRIVRYREVLAKSKRGDWFVVLRERYPSVALGEKWAQIESLAESMGALPAVGDNEAWFLVDLDEFARRLEQDIDAAQHHIHMVFYIFRDDKTGRRVAEALARAVERGVKCRVLADAIGSRAMFKTLAPWMEERGIDVLPALPINPLRGRLVRIDLRNHRKIVVVDGKVGYLGSWNVADPDFGPKRVPEYHDIMLRVCGAAVHQVQMLFLEDWNSETQGFPDDEDLFPQPESKGDAILQALPSGPLYPSTPFPDLPIAAINEARRRVIITTPYFAPDEALLLALRLAVRRGVEVDIIVPFRSDSVFIDAAARAYCRELLEEHIHLYSYRPGFLHAKILTIDDDFALMGTANYDIRSFRLDVEANFLIYSKEHVEVLRTLQEHYMQNSERWDRETLDSRPFWQKQLDYSAKLLSPIL